MKNENELNAFEEVQKANELLKSHKLEETIKFLYSFFQQFREKCND